MFYTHKLTRFNIMMHSFSAATNKKKNKSCKCTSYQRRHGYYCDICKKRLKIGPEYGPKN